MYELKQPQIQDIIELSNILRPADKQEIEHLGVFANTLDALLFSHTTSEESYIDYVDGTPGLIGGVNADGCIWCMTSEDYITSHTKRFLEVTNEYISRFQRDHKVLWNYIHKDNEVHIKWILRSGFEEIRQEPYGNKGEQFILFERR